MIHYKNVAILDVPLDFNSSHLRGPADAPPIIRRVLFNGSANTTSESAVDVAKDSRVLDAGSVQWETQQQAFANIEQRCTALGEQGAKILTLGGDHSITFPIIKALAKQHDNITILHFDAHPDLYDNQDGNQFGHGCPFARIMEGQFAARLVQVGIRTLNQHQADQAKKFGVEVHEMKNWSLDTPLYLEGPLYISFDLDALDPAYAPGVSHFEPGGLSVREVLQVLSTIDQPVVGADIVEYNPKQDINEMTAMVCAKIYKELTALLLRDCI